MRKQDAFRDGEAEAGAVGAAGEKRIEDAVADFFRDAGAIVGDVDQRQAGAVASVASTWSTAGCSGS